jgi:hypothetical protein
MAGLCEARCMRVEGLNVTCTELEPDLSHVADALPADITVSVPL